MIPRIPLAPAVLSWFTANALQLRAAQPLPVAGRAFAALLAALYLLLSLASVDHALHACWHEDAGLPEHQCVLTLLSHCQVALDLPATELVVTGSCLIELLPSTEIFPIPACPRLPPGRGPPAV